MPDRSNTWDGGYIRTDSNGRKSYYVYRKINGKLYEFSTRCRTGDAAHKVLRQWEADHNFRPSDELDDGSLVLDGAMVADFLKWSRETKKNTPAWVHDQGVALKWWLSVLPVRDFRKFNASDIVKHLDVEPAARKQKIATLKALATWLVKHRHVMEARENPTAGILVPQSSPEQWTKPKAMSEAVFKTLRRQLSGVEPWADVLDVLGGTGWHFTELQRFVIAGGSVTKHPTEKGARVLDCPQTKSGEPLRVQVSASVAASAKRLLGKPLSYFDFRKVLISACKEAGIEADIRPGQFRHSVGSWAVNKGAPIAAVASFLNHKSPATTKRFYATHAVPGKVPTLR